MPTMDPPAGKERKLPRGKLKAAIINYGKEKEKREKSIFMVFDNPEAQPESSVDLLACRRCRNKTYRIEIYEDDCAGTLHCAGCGARIGKFGWVPED